MQTSLETYKMRWITNDLFTVYVNRRESRNGCGVFGFGWLVMDCFTAMRLAMTEIGITHQMLRTSR